MKHIDLSISITANMPVYPGDPVTKIDSAGIIEKDGFEAHYFSMLNHIGTHIDAPSHMIKNGKNLDKFPLETFTGRGICIEIANKQFDLSLIKNANIQRGDVVL